MSLCVSSVNHPPVSGCELSEGAVHELFSIKSLVRRHLGSTTRGGGVRIDVFLLAASKKKKRKKTSLHMQGRRSYLLKLFIKLISAELTFRSHVIVYTNVQSALGERKQREGFYAACSNEFR